MLDRANMKFTLNGMSKPSYGLHLFLLHYVLLFYFHSHVVVQTLEIYLIYSFKIVYEKLLRISKCYVFI